MKKSFIKVLIVACSLITSLGVNADNGLNIVPKPVRTTVTGGELMLRDGCSISYPKGYNDLVEYTANMIKERTGWRKVKQTNSSADIVLRIDDSIKEAEAYSLQIDGKGVMIKAATKAGLFYGVQTLRQLLPIQPSNTVSLPCVEIYDYPRFGWRGLHLDVSRHFFDAGQVKRFLEVMAMYKFNRFHWHLTDDQGWRLEIKSHPELTEIGAWRKGKGFAYNQHLGFNVEDGTRYGGFYTQEEVKDVIAYAEKLGITIIPEIDLPGHSTAAIVACPQVFCFPDKKMEVRMEGGVSEGVMCAGREETFALLEDVLDEVVALFPSKYIHLGGDEAPKAGWKHCEKCQARIKAEGLADENELQSYFMKRLERYINGKGRKMIGWDEIMEGGVSETATVMSWRGVLPGREAAMGGNDVIMTPGSYVYLNAPQSVNSVTRATGDVLNLRKVYEYNPMPVGLNAEAEKHIIGVQACQWSEHTPTDSVLYYKEYPRAIALAEVAWTPQKDRAWGEFYTRLQNHLPQLAHYGVHYGAPSYDVGIDFGQSGLDGMPVVKFTTEVPSAIYYTTDGTEPNRKSTVFSNPIKISGSTTIKACMYRPDGSQGRVASQYIHFHKALGKKVVYNLPYSEKHDGGGDFAMTNGMLGRWQGFEKQDADFVLDLGTVQSIDSISSNWKYDIMDWVLRPTSVRYSVSADGTDYTEVYNENIVNTPGDFSKGVIEVKCGKHLDNVRYIRVQGTSEKINPRWHSSAGAACWIFVDEILVK